MRIDFESYLVHCLQNNDFKIKQVSITNQKEAKDTVAISQEAKDLFERHFKKKQIQHQ